MSTIGERRVLTEEFRKDAVYIGVTRGANIEFFTKIVFPGILLCYH